jgi:type III secretion protein L
MGQYAFISDADLRIAPGTRVVKANEYAGYVEGARVLEEARRKAAAILLAARATASEMRDQGFAEGLKLGKESSSKYMLGIVTKSRDHLADNEERIVALVISVLKKVLGEMDEKEVVVRMVRTAMAVVSRQNQVTVLVAPDMVETVKAGLYKILQPYPRVTMVDVVGDAKILGTDCVLETKVGRVEASLESQLKTITGALSDLAPGRKERLEADLKAIEIELSAGLVGDL